MRRRRPIALALLALLAPLACGGPVGPLAGGRLRGETHKGPVESWDFAAPVETIQLETRPEDPHSVNVWSATVEGRLYVPSSMILGPETPTERAWVRHATDDPRVRLRIDGTIYAAEARRVEGVEYEAALAALDRKYAQDPAGRDGSREIWIFRIHPR